MPGFTVSASEFTVAEYCGKVARKELVVNKDYQRTDGVWPDAARSFLVESALLGYPVPKLSVRSITNLKTRETVNEIVDGQQRTKALVDYFNNLFAVSKDSEIVDARGKTYDDLPTPLQQSFISFRLQVDIFSGATSDEIRELFRRMNSYTVSLNHEEKRHARWQGEMKWFIYRLCKDLSPVLEKLGVLSEKQLARMQDTKLVADVVYALLHGIQTTKPENLNNLYEQNDSAFPSGSSIKKKITEAVAQLGSIPELRGSELLTPYNFYSLLLATIHLHTRIQPLKSVWDGGKQMRKADQLIVALDKLNGVLSADEDSLKGADLALWRAATTKTNTKEHREIRFRAFCEALSV